jgi:hypothetical protein
MTRQYRRKKPGWVGTADTRSTGGCGCCTMPPGQHAYLIRCGKLWRGVATAGLRALGLDPPPAEDEAQ